MESRREAESILKMKIFYTTKCKAHLLEKLNTSKGDIWSRELALPTEEMSAALGKQGITSTKIITIRKREEKIETITHILTFDRPHIPKW